MILNFNIFGGGASFHPGGRAGVLSRRSGLNLSETNN